MPADAGNCKTSAGLCKTAAALLAAASRIGPGGAGLSTFLSPLEKEAGNAIVKAGGALIVLSMQDFGNADAIANLKQGGGVERHGRLGGFFAKMFRSSATQASNFANKHADSETSCHENEGSAYLYSKTNTLAEFLV